MARVEETIPEALQDEVAAAVDWWNAHQDVAFDVTGIVDPDTAGATQGTRELRLVLCGGDRCEQRSFRVTGQGDGYAIDLLGEPESADAVQPELDPPPGALRGWLAAKLAQHDFVVLVFYRGFW